MILINLVFHYYYLEVTMSTPAPKIESSIITKMSPIDKLCTAAKNGDLKEFTELSLNIDMNTIGSGGAYPIHYAARYNRTEILNFIIEFAQKHNRLEIIKAKTTKGNYAISIARNNNCKEAWEILNKVGDVFFKEHAETIRKKVQSEKTDFKTELSKFLELMAVATGGHYAENPIITGKKPGEPLIGQFLNANAASDADGRDCSCQAEGAGVQAAQLPAQEQQPVETQLKQADVEQDETEAGKEKSIKTRKFE